jgi:hypothetical protein
MFAMLSNTIALFSREPYKLVRASGEAALIEDVT